MPTPPRVRLTDDQAPVLLAASNDPAMYLSGLAVVDVNPLLTHWLGCSRDDLIQSSVLDWSAPDQHDGYPANELFDECLERAQEVGYVRFAWVFRKSDDTEWHAQVSMRAIEWASGASHLYVTVHDTNDLKSLCDQSARHVGRFRAMFDASPDPLWLLKGNVFIGCNHAAVQALGYSSRAELLNKHPSELSPDVQPDGEDSHSKANLMGKIAYKTGSHTFEWLHRRANGEVFWTEVTLKPVEIDIGEVMLCVWRDISAQKQREQQLLRLLKDMEQEIGHLKGSHGA